MKHPPASDLKGRFDRQTTLKITSQMESDLNRVAIYQQQTKASVEREFLRAGIEQFRSQSDAHRSLFPPHNS